MPRQNSDDETQDRRIGRTQAELANRWDVSTRTLQRWRRNGKGPEFLRLGGRVIYRLDDIERFEEAARRRPGGAE